MTFEEMVEYCDGLEFLKKDGDIIYNPQFCMQLAKYRLLHDLECIFSFGNRRGSGCVPELFFQRVYACNPITKEKLYEYISFEDFFEGVSPSSKEGLVFHLDFFRKSASGFEWRRNEFS